MKFHSEKAKRIASHVRKNPKAKAQDVAKELGVALAYVYNIKHRLKKAKAKRVEPSSVRKQGWKAKLPNDPRMPVFKAKPMPLPNSYNDVTSEVTELMGLNQELRNQVLDCKAVISYLENALYALIRKQ
jgi:hypothetical protein